MSKATGRCRGPLVEHTSRLGLLWPIESPAVSRTSSGEPERLGAERIFLLNRRATQEKTVESAIEFFTASPRMGLSNMAPFRLVKLIPFYAGADIA